MWPHSTGKGTFEYLEQAPSPLARASFQSRLLTFLRPHNLELNLDDSQMQVLFEISDEYRRRGIAIEQMRKDKLVLDWKKRKILMDSIERRLDVLRTSLENKSLDHRFANTALLAKSTARKLSRFQTKLKDRFSLVGQHQGASESMYKVLSFNTLRDEYVGHLDYYLRKCAFPDLPQLQRDIVLAGSMLAAGFLEDQSDLVERIAMARSRARRAIEEASLDDDDGPVFQTEPRKRRT